MPTLLPAKPFNPTITTVPILGPSSGNPDALKDPKSVASIGGQIQAMQDQANADQLYDTPKKEGFCMEESTIKLPVIVLLATGTLCILYSLR
jgi:hypothetical protein